MAKLIIEAFSGKGREGKGRKGREGKGRDSV
jgi:hypothetical protein